VIDKLVIYLITFVHTAKFCNIQRHPVLDPAGVSRNCSEATDDYRQPPPTPIFKDPSITM